jgi:hypothetical protein
MPNFTAARLSASENAALSRSPASGCSLGEPTSILVTHSVAELHPEPADHRPVGQELS